jgi:nucleotide-binding universal stress UspA family protein
MSRQKLILHPNDLSPRSMYALKIARSLAREQGACLEVVHVVPMAADADTRREAEQALASIVEADTGIAMRWTLLSGDVAENVLWMAREFRPDLIVLAGRKRTGLAALWATSVSRSIKKRSPCPVVRLVTPDTWLAPPSPQSVGLGVRPTVVARSSIQRPPAASAPRCQSCDQLFGKDPRQRSHRERILS